MSKPEKKCLECGQIKEIKAHDLTANMSFCLECGMPVVQKKPEKKKKIQPRKQWLLVKPSSNKTQVQNGIILPANIEQEQKAQGVVEAVGEEVKGIKAGETVVYGAYAGENVSVNEDGTETKYKLLMDEDIIAFIR